MNANDYQHLAARTLIDRPDAEYTPDELIMVWSALGLVGEAGEAANLIKKAVFHRHDFDQSKLVDELGDILWYIAAIMTGLDLPLSLAMQGNIDKILRRYPNGYRSADSIARSE